MLTVKEKMTLDLERTSFRYQASRDTRIREVIVEAWRTEYNTYRPHSSLGDLTPAEYAATWTSPTQPALS